MEGFESFLLAIAIACFLLAAFFGSLALLCRVLAWSVEEIGLAIAQLWGDEKKTPHLPVKDRYSLERPRESYIEIYGKIITESDERAWEDFMQKLSALTYDARYKALELDVV